MSRQQEYKGRNVAAGKCRNCPAPRVDGTYCREHRELERARHKERRHAASLPYIIDPANICGWEEKPGAGTCGELAAYGVFIATPVHPVSNNWHGKVEHAVTHYCEEHAQVVQAPLASVRRLRISR